MLARKSRSDELIAGGDRELRHGATSTATRPKEGRRSVPFCSRLKRSKARRFAYGPHFPIRNHSVNTVPSVRGIFHRRRSTVSDRSGSTICSKSPEILSPRKAALVRKTQVQDSTDLAVLKGFLRHQSSPAADRRKPCRRSNLRRNRCESPQQEGTQRWLTARERVLRTESQRERCQSQRHPFVTREPGFEERTPRHRSLVPDTKPEAFRCKLILCQSQ